MKKSLFFLLCLSKFSLGKPLILIEPRLEGLGGVYYFLVPSKEPIPIHLPKEAEDVQVVLGEGDLSRKEESWSFSPSPLQDKKESLNLYGIGFLVQGGRMSWPDSKDENWFVGFRKFSGLRALETQGFVEGLPPMLQGKEEFHGWILQENPAIFTVGGWPKNHKQFMVFFAFLWAIILLLLGYLKWRRAHV